MTASLKPLDLKKCGSAERGEVVIDWVLSNLGAANAVASVEAELGREFWNVVEQHWASFDRINHEFYEHMFARFRPYWLKSSTVQNLPKKLQSWRGQNRHHQQFGLSWTTDRTMAEKFARGLRHTNPDPVLYQTTVNKTEVALVLNDRNESEIVLFQRPMNFAEEAMELNAR